MVRVRTTLLVRKSRKLIAQHASERQCAFVHVFFPLTRHPCRNTDASLVDTMLRYLYRAWRARTIDTQIDHKIHNRKRPRQLCLSADVFRGLLV